MRDGRPRCGEFSARLGLAAFDSQTALAHRLRPLKEKRDLLLTPRVFCAVAAVLLGLLAAPAPADAQGPALSLLPQDNPSSSPWSIFSRQHTPAAPQPDPEPEPAPEAAAEPQEKVTAGKASLPPKPSDKAAAKTEVGWKRVNVPLPPVADPALRAIAAKELAAAAKPPEPKATGIFALFSGTGAPAVEAPANDAAETSILVRAVGGAPPSSAMTGPASRATQVTRLDLSNPFRPRPVPRAGEEEEGLDDEEASKIAEKQVDSVQIACLKPSLMAMIQKAGDHFGAKPVITSGFRANGRRGSYHRKCEAADFFIPDVPAARLVQFLRQMPGAGGVGTYCHTKSVHLDIGEPRNWHQCGFRRSFALRLPALAENGSR